MRFIVSKVKVRHTGGKFPNVTISIGLIHTIIPQHGGDVCHMGSIVSCFFLPQIEKHGEEGTADPIRRLPLKYPSTWVIIHLHCRSVDDKVR